MDRLGHHPVRRGTPPRRTGRPPPHRPHRRRRGAHRRAGCPRRRAAPRPIRRGAAATSRSRSVPGLHEGGAGTPSGAGPRRDADEGGDAHGRCRRRPAARSSRGRARAGPSTTRNRIKAATATIVLPMAAMATRANRPHTCSTAVATAPVAYSTTWGMKNRSRWVDLRPLVATDGSGTPGRQAAGPAGGARRSRPRLAPEPDHRHREDAGHLLAPGGPRGGRGRRTSGPAPPTTRPPPAARTGRWRRGWPLGTRCPGTDVPRTAAITTRTRTAKARGRSRGTAPIPAADAIGAGSVTAGARCRRSRVTSGSTREWPTVRRPRRSSARTRAARPTAVSRSVAVVTTGTGPPRPRRDGVVDDVRRTSSEAGDRLAVGQLPRPSAARPGATPGRQHVGEDGGEAAVRPPSPRAGWPDTTRHSGPRSPGDHQHPAVTGVGDGLVVEVAHRSTEQCNPTSSSGCERRRPHGRVARRGVSWPRPRPRSARPRWPRCGAAGRSRHRVRDRQLAELIVVALEDPAPRATRASHARCDASSQPGPRPPCVDEDSSVPRVAMTRSTGTCVSRSVTALRRARTR